LSYLKKFGNIVAEVEPEIFLADTEIIFRQHNELLHQCDAIHVFAGKGSQLWRALDLDLEELIIPEQYLIALERVYGTVLKLSGNPNEENQTIFTGHIITWSLNEITPQ
jgi:hypothetical protein